MCDMYQLLWPTSQAELTPFFIAWDTGCVHHNWVVQRKAGFQTYFFRSKMLESFIKTPPQLLNKIDLNGQMDMKTSKSAPRTQQNETAWNSMEQVVALWIWTPKMRISKLGCRLLLRDLAFRHWNWSLFVALSLSRWRLDMLKSMQKSASKAPGMAKASKL